MPRVISFGEALIDIFGGVGVSLRELKLLQPSPGGAPANVAVGLARLGIDVGFIGRVGDDSYGHFLIDLLKKEGVDTKHFLPDSGGPTMLAIVEAPGPTEQRFTLYHGADTFLHPEDLDRGYIESARVFVFGSVTLTAAGGPAALAAARLSRDAGNVVVFDVNLRPTLWPDDDTARRGIREGIDAATVVKLNRLELEFVTGYGDLAEGSREILRIGAGLVCVSLGADGAYFDNGTARGNVPSREVRVVDTTGSGDAFVAGLAAELGGSDVPISELDSGRLYAFVDFANGCGALAATRQGAMSGLPSRKAVEAFIGDR